MVDSAAQSINTQYLPASYLDSNGALKDGISPDKAAEVSSGIQARVADMSNDERGLYLAAVKSPDFSPKASTTVEDSEVMLSDMEAVLERLAQSTNANAASLLGRALVELGAQQRQEALDNRLNARSIARSELGAGADKLREGAQDLRDSAKSAMITSIVTSSIAIVAAGAGGAGGIAAMKTSGSALGKISQATDDMSEGAKMLQGGQLANVANKASGQAGLGSAVSTAGGSTGTMGNAISQKQSAEGQADAQLAQAQQNEFQAEAEVTKGEGDLEASEQQALQEFVNQLIQFLKEMRDAEVEQMAVVTRG